MKKIGILGGTFNPVHLAHLMIAEAVYETMKLDEILFIPSGCSYMKELSEIASDKDRISMTGLAIEDNPHFALSTIELEREGNSYTFETLEELHRRYPDQEYYLILGADNLFTMETWYKPERIFAACTVLAAVRGSKKTKDMETQIQKLQEKYDAKIKLLPVKHIDISSTSIREKIQKEESIRYIVPEKVREYIIKRGLYQETDI